MPMDTMTGDTKEREKHLDKRMGNSIEQGKSRRFLRRKMILKVKMMAMITTTRCHSQASTRLNSNNDLVNLI